MLRRSLALLGCLFLAVFSALGGTPNQAWTPERWFEKARSGRVANYHIKGVLDWESKTLKGWETITWRNTGSAPTQEFPLHLYLNAFRGPQSPFLENGEVPQGGNRGGNRIWGGCRLDEVRVGGRELSGHYGEDETTWWVQLPEAVAPGQSLQLEVAWETRFPRLMARSGWSGLFLMGAQWFPKAGVYRGDRWQCAPYRPPTEFFADFGVYDVELSLPNALLLAHTGTSIPQKGKDGRDYDAAPDPERPLNGIWRLHAEDVHDFAWAVMPQRSWSYRHYEYRHTQIFHFFQPEHSHHLERVHEAVKAALRSGAEWGVPYPYPVLTVVDVPASAEPAAGMEYPTLFTLVSESFEPFHLRWGAEETAIHEVGHQWFQGLLASNEVEEPWLDEGLTTWFTMRVMERSYQNTFSSRRFLAGVDFESWLVYWMRPSAAPVLSSGRNLRPELTYEVSAYAKPFLVLQQLEALLGRPAVEQAIRGYVQEQAFRHPTAQDLRRHLEKAAGRSLEAFWKDFMEGTAVLDYGIREVGQTPGGGFIRLERRGGIQVPLTLWARLADRTEQRVVWDGKETETTFTFSSPVVAAVLDPDGNHPLLKDRLHASWTAQPVRRGLHYWSQMVWGGLMALLQGAGLG